MYKRCTFYAPFLPFICKEIVGASRMYKKLHKAEIVTSSESLPTKGSLFMCVPEEALC